MATVMKMADRMRVAGMIASISAVVFAVPHFWFWYGVSVAYPGDFQNLSRDSALLIVGGFAVLAAAYAIVFTHSSWVRRLPEYIAALPAWVGGVGFTLWGLTYFGLQVQLAFGDAASSDQYFASEANPNAVWGLYWYALFTVWGLSLGTAAFCFHRLNRRQTRAAQEVLRLDIGDIRTHKERHRDGQKLKEGPCESGIQERGDCHENRVLPRI